MNRTMKLALVAVGLLVVAAWLAPELTPEQKTARQQEQAAKQAEKAKRDEALSARVAEDIRKNSAINAAKKAVVARLKDPSSAKFGKVVYRPDGVVCGYVNAKNSFGAMTGEKAFISLGTADGTWLHGESKDFESTWNKRCAS